MAVRYPRPYAKIRNVMIPLEEMRVTRSAERSADRFDVTIAASYAIRQGFELNDFADWQPQDVEVLLGLQLGADPQSLMIGRVDCPKIKWKDNRITLDGRDKSTLLIDKVRSENFKNQKTEDIVKQIAKDHGLTAHVQSKASYAGKVTSRDDTHAHLALGRTDYDIMSDLAAREGCRWYVDGNDLYLEPRDTDAGSFDIYWCPPGTQAAYATANCVDLDTSRNMTAARPHKVRGRGWHHHEAQQHEATAEMGGVGEPIEYEYHHNGKKRPELQGLMDGRLADHTRHDLQIRARMPVDLSVTPRKRLNLSGTGTIYDQSYDCDTVEITAGWEEAAEMELHGKSAKDGRSTGQGASSGSGAGQTGTSAVQGPPAPITSPPSPPRRPAGL